MTRFICLLAIFLGGCATVSAQTCEQRWSDILVKTAVIQPNKKPSAAQVTALKATEAAFHVAGCVAPDLPPPQPPPLPPPTQTLLQQSDFTYLGYYDVPNQIVSNGCDLHWGQGFTARRVAGQLRFVTLCFSSQRYHLIELAEPAAFGLPISVITNEWSDLGDTWSNGWWIGLSWDEPRQCLWTTAALDYPDNTNLDNAREIYCATLGDHVVTQWRGPYGLQGIGARQMFGGVQHVPADFQQTYGVGSLAFGFGGYVSRLCQGTYPGSLGLTLFLSGDPLLGAANTSIPAVTAASHAAGCASPDWYTNGAPSTFDRGTRNADVINYFDDPGQPQNPPGAPSGPPTANAQWLSPAPDLTGRWVYSDTYLNTGLWITTATKHGFVAVGSHCSGKAYYSNSTLNCDRITFDRDIYDPSQFGAVIQGTRQPWAVQPVSTEILQLPGMGAEGQAGDTAQKRAGGAAFDNSSTRLFLYGLWTDTQDNRIYVYAVN